MPWSTESRWIIEEECWLFVVYWGFTVHIPITGSRLFPSETNQSTRAHGIALSRWVTDKRRRTQATCIDEKPGNVISVVTSMQLYRGTVNYRGPVWALCISVLNKNLLLRSDSFGIQMWPGAEDQGLETHLADSYWLSFSHRYCRNKMSEVKVSQPAGVQNRLRRPFERHRDGGPRLKQRGRKEVM